jgi:hypothetical protein
VVVTLAVARRSSLPARRTEMVDLVDVAAVVPGVRLRVKVVCLRARSDLMVLVLQDALTPLAGATDTTSLFSVDLVLLVILIETFAAWPRATVLGADADTLTAGLDLDLVLLAALAGTAAAMRRASASRTARGVWGIAVPHTQNPRARARQHQRGAGTVCVA